MTVKRTSRPEIKAFLAILLLAGLVCMGGCKKQQPPTESRSPDLPEPGNTRDPRDGPVANYAPPSASLAAIIKAAKTWGPAFSNWIGRPAPDFTLTDLEGNQHTLSTYKGKKVMLVFWASWCGPCKLEIPDLKKVRDASGEDQLAMLAITREDPGIVKPFVTQQQVNYTVLLNSGSLPRPFNEVNQIPCSFFIDANGLVRLATTGPLALADIQAILAAIG